MPQKPAPRKPNKVRATHKKAPRANAAEQERRIQSVYERLLHGARRFEILQFVAKTWGGSARTADDLIAAANALIKHQAAQTRDENFAEQVALRRSLRSKAAESNDYRLMLDIARDEAKLLDLYPAEKQKIETETPILLSLDR